MHLVSLNRRRNLRIVDFGEIWGDLARSGEIWRDLVKFGEMWEFVPGWPVPHLVWDYAATILDFVKFFVIFVKNARKCILGDFR